MMFEEIAVESPSIKAVPAKDSRDIPNDLMPVMNALLHQNRLAEAYLFVCSDFHPYRQIIERWVSSVFCKQKQNGPCGQCQSCILISRQQHPDLHWMLPEKEGANIKVEQIRHLQQSIYTGTHHASERFYVIPRIETMNKACSNALLKILEEPPQHCHFILLCSQLLTVLPTIISRCHKVSFPEPGCFSEILMKADLLDESHPKAALLAMTPELIKDLLLLSKLQTSAIDIAEKLKIWPVDELLWLFYGLFAEVAKPVISSVIPGNELTILKDSANNRKLLDLLTKITMLRKKIAGNVNLNTLLVLEDILISWVKIYE